LQDVIGTVSMEHGESIQFSRDDELLVAEFASIRNQAISLLKCGGANSFSSLPDRQ
jgi:hypothetical protein